MTDFTEIWRAIRTADFVQEHMDLHEAMNAHHERQMRARKTEEQRLEELKQWIEWAVRPRAMDLDGGLNSAGMPKRPNLLDPKHDMFFNEIPQED